MTLRELRERFVRMVGRSSLVATHTVDGRTVADYSVDNGADYYINEGIRILDESLPYPAATRLEDFSIAVDEYEVLVPNLRSIERAVLTDGSDTENNNDLRIRTIKQMYEHFQRPFHLLDSGLPYYITRGPVREITTDEYGAEMLPNGDFSDDDEGWELGADWSFDGTKMVVSEGTEGVDRLLLTYLDEVITGRTAHVVFDITFDNSPASETNRLWFDLGSRQEEVLQLGSFIASGEYTVEVKISEFDFIAIRAGADFAGSVNSVSIKNVLLDSVSPVLVLPPSDAARTLRIWGNFWTERLVENTDTNYWAANHPGLVVVAAGIWHEIELRNSSGAGEWRKELDRRLAMVDFDAVEEDLNQIRYPYP